MHTSNKILVALVAFLFLVPAFMLAAFRLKIAGGRFTLEQYSPMAKPRLTTLKPASILVLRGNDQTELYSAIGYGDSASCELLHHNTADSLVLKQSGDTLFVELQSKGGGIGAEKTNMYLQLRMPSIRTVIASGAQVTVDSLPVSEPVDFRLLDKSGLELGRPEEDSLPAYFGPYFIIASNSRVSLLGTTVMPSLKLQLSGKSELNIAPAASIGKIEGSAGSSVLVSGPSRYLYRLQEKSGL